MRDLTLYKKGLKVLSKDAAVGEGVIDFSEVFREAELAGCEYYVIDAGWYAPGEWWDSVGEWQECRERFPNGIKEVTDYIRAYSSADGGPAVFHFPAGEQKISVVSNDSEIIIKQLRVVQLPAVPTYEEYKSLHSGQVYDGAPLIIEGEDYAVKNDSAIRSKAGNSAAVTPYHPYYKWISGINRRHV